MIAPAANLDRLIRAEALDEPLPEEAARLLADWLLDLADQARDRQPAAQEDRADG